MKYHIFKVYDYKGGELNSRINLSKEQVASEIYNSYRLYDIEFEGGEDDAAITELIDEKIDEDAGEYAGGDGVVIEIFRSHEDGLVGASWGDFDEPLLALVKKQFGIE